METDRYPRDLAITIDDFRATPCKAILEAARGVEAVPGQSHWTAFSKEAREAISAGKLKEGKIYWILADICSMSLDPESTNAPFKPFIIMATGNRSVQPSDFEPADIEFLTRIVGEVDDPWLQARLADLIWHFKRDYRGAITAIQSYQKLPLDLGSWLGGGQETWTRALQLALALGKGARTHVVEIEGRILEAMLSTASKDGFLGMWLGDLLFRLYMGSSKELVLATHLEALGTASIQEGEFRRGREYFLAAEKWHVRRKDKREGYRMLLLAADALEKDASARIAGENPSHLVAAGFLEQVIQTLRRIPKAERGPLGVDSKIAEVHTRLSEAGEKGLKEMGTVSSGKIDISKMVELAQEAVSGKSLREALYEFAFVYPGLRVEKIRTAAEKYLRQSIVNSLFGATRYSRDGRVISKRPAMSLSLDGSSDNEEILWDEMVSAYSRQLQLVVQAYVFPALETMQMEHVIHEADLVQIANLAPVIPPGRERLYGRALFKGFDGDFASALHLLVPQIENMVRWHLKQNGAKTTTLDDQGIEMENGLSTLVENALVREIFGDDVAFEMKALFCDAAGPNLRNELAHGLLGFEASQSVYSIYAWWFGLRLAVITYWNAASDRTSPQDGLVDPSDGSAHNAEAPDEG